MLLFSILLGTKYTQLFQNFHFCGANRNSIRINEIYLTNLEFEFIIENRNGCWQEFNVCDSSQRFTEISCNTIIQKIYRENEIVSEKSVSFTTRER
jgi:hypothetical protein